MKRLMPLLAGILAIGGLTLVLPRLLPEKPAPPASPTPAPDASAPPPVPGAPSVDDSPPRLWIRRIGDEVLLLSVSGDGRRPSSGARVEFLDATGSLLGSGRSDSCGAFRDRIPAGSVTVTLRRGTGGSATASLPQASFDSPMLVSSHNHVWPGCRFLVSVRSQTSEAGPTLHIEPVPDAYPEAVLEPASAPNGPSHPPEGWRTFQAMVPEDARPGTAVVRFAGQELRMRLGNRFAPEEALPGRPHAVPPGTGTGSIRFEEHGGVWHATGPAETAAVLFFADSGGRILVHQAALAVEGNAETSLPVGEDPGSAVRFTAVAGGPGGFSVSSVGSPGTKAPPRILFQPSSMGPEMCDPEWVHDGDVATGITPPPESRPGYLEREVDAVLRPGLATATVPGDVPVRWEVRPSGAAGSLRIRADGAIVAEARFAAGRGAGAFRITEPGDHAVRVECGDPAVSEVRLAWTIAEKPVAAPARPGAGVAFDRTLPETGPVGAEFVYKVVIQIAEERPAAVVTCPIPRGAVPAEDGWSIRERAPAGTRVETPDGAIVYRIPALGPGETILSFRIRLKRPGRYFAPAATCGSARSASGFLVIE